MIRNVNGFPIDTTALAMRAYKDGAAFVASIVRAAAAAGEGTREHARAEAMAHVLDERPELRRALDAETL